MLSTGMEEVLAEIPRVRKDLGYPPLVTPTSQIVGTQAVLERAGKWSSLQECNKGSQRLRARP